MFLNSRIVVLEFVARERLFPAMIVNTVPISSQELTHQILLQGVWSL